MKNLTDNEIKLLKKLEENLNLFKEIKEHLDVTDTVGLGVLPKAHKLYSPALFTQSFLKDGEITYIVTSPSVSPNKTKLEKDESQRLIILPDYNLDRSYIISIFQKNIYNPEKMEEKLLDCSQDLLAGFYAHEFAHLNDLLELTPPQINDKLDDVLPLTCMSLDIPYSKEIKADLIAARYGYKKQMFDVLEYMIAYISSYLSSTKSKAIKENAELKQVSPEKVLEILDTRKIFVTQFS